MHTFRELPWQRHWLPAVLDCLKSYHPDWSNDQLITQLLGTADNIDSLNPNYINMLGTGRVNAYRMLVEEDVMPLFETGIAFGCFC